MFSGIFHETYSTCNVIYCATLINSSFLLYYIRDISWQTRHQIITENIRLRWKKVTECYKEHVKMKKELQPWVMVVIIFAYIWGKYFPLYLQTFFENRKRKHISRNDPPERYIIFCFFSYIHWHIAMHPIISDTYWVARNNNTIYSKSSSSWINWSFSHLKRFMPAICSFHKSIINFRFMIINSYNQSVHLCWGT